MLATGRGGVDDMDWGRKTNRLKPEVLAWLQANVKDRPLAQWQRELGDQPQGWCIGTDKYNSRDSLNFSVFFERTGDAMKFIKRWSSHGKPVDYLNYFRDVRKKLNPTTGRLTRVAR